MTAAEWRKSCGADDAILSSCIDDLEQAEQIAALNGAWVVREPVRAEKAEAEVRERERAAFVAGVKWWGVAYKELKSKQARDEAKRRYGGEA